MFPGNNDDLRVIGKDFFEVVGYFTIDGASAVGVQTPTVAQGAPYTVSKPGATTGVYRITFNNFTANDVFYGDANFLVTGTYDRDIFPLAKNTNSQGFVTSFDFQVRKSSDGTVVDPVSSTVQFRVVCKASSLRP